MSVTRVIVLILAALTALACDPVDVVVLGDPDAGSLFLGEQAVCTAAQPGQAEPPPEQRCLQVPCYANDFAPTQTVAQATSFGDGRPILIVEPNSGLLLGEIPDRSAIITAHGSGCYDCPQTHAGSVTHRAAFDDFGLLGGGASAGVVTALDVQCAVLARPDSARPELADAAVVDALFACMNSSGIFPGELREVGDVHLMDYDATAGQRAQLGDCLALACAAFNTFRVDRDQDGVGDVCDNCVNTHNIDQANVAGAWLGDVCDDTDGDGINDADDNCVSDANPEQSNVCGDDDGDGIPNGEDACPEIASADGDCRLPYDDDVAACEIQGSIVGVEQQTLGEVLALPGTGLGLRYSSQRVPGFKPPGAPHRDARSAGFGGWTLTAQHQYEAGDPARVLLGQGGSFPITRRFEHPDGDLIPDPSDAVAYVFDAQQRHVQTVDATDGRVLLAFEYTGGQLSAVVDDRGQRVEIDRPAADQIRIIGPLGDTNRLTLDARGYLATLTVPGDRIWMTFHDEVGLLSTIAPPRQVAADSPQRHRFEYDAEGLLIRDFGLDGGRLILTRSDDDGGRVVRTERAMDEQGGAVRERVHTWRIDADGGRQTEFADRMQRTEILDGDALQGYESGHRTIDPDGGRVTVRLDAGDRWAGEASKGETVFEPAPGTGLDPITIHTTERYVLAADGGLGARSLTQIEQITRHAGAIVSQTQIWPKGDGLLFDGLPFTRSVSAEGRISTAVRKNGRLATLQLGDLLPVEYSYDARGRIEKIRQGGRTTTWAYDDVNRVSTVTDPTGRQRRVLLDDALDPIRVDNPALPDEAVTRTYDDGGDLQTVGTPSGEYRWERTEGGRAHRQIAPGNQITDSTYGRDGRLLSTTKGNGRTTRIEYADVTGLPIQVEGPDATITHTWRGDLRPRATELSPRVLSDGTAIEVDERVDYQASRPIGTTRTVRIDAVAHAVQIGSAVDAETWDATALTITDAQAVTHTIDLAADRDGLPTQIGDLHIERDGGAVGLPSRETFGQFETDRLYNGHGEVDSITTRFDGVARLQHGFQRANSGELQAIETCFRANCVTQRYTFDEDGQLTRMDASDGRFVEYTYDASGNRLTRTDLDGVEQATWIGAGDRLLEYAGATFGYDDLGQRVRATNTPRGDWTYTYDSHGGLLRAERGPENPIDIEYVLDASGRRIGRRVDGGPITWWLYAGLRPIAEFDADLGLTAVFVYGTGHTPDHMITYANGEETGRYRFMTDHIGSVVGLMSDAGEWVERTEYSPFGRVTSRYRADDAPSHPFGYAGGFADDETELVRFGARDYDPWTGRWLARDPIGLGGGDVNLYGYVGNDPVRFFDPTGLVEVPGKAAVAAWQINQWLGTDLRGAHLDAVAAMALEEAATGIATGGASPLLRVGKWLGGKVADLGRWAWSKGASLRRSYKARVVANCNPLRLPRSLGAAANISIRSRIGEMPYAVRLAQRMSQQAQRDVDNLLAAVRSGNSNPGIGTRALGDQFFELRGRNGGRVIVRELSAGELEVVGKFQGHVRGASANSGVIRTLMDAYNQL